MPLKNGRSSAALQAIVVGSVIPPGSIAPFSGATVPEGWFLCDGSAISRVDYPALFSAIGTAHGQGNGSTTFNLPDYRGQFLRGRVNISTVTGSGTASSNQATFTNHGINRTGFRVRLSSGTLSGLAASTDYFAIVVDANTLAFATTQANALAGTRTAISGTNTAIITQFEDPDASSRLAPNVGGNNGNSIGSVQADQFASHQHLTRIANNTGGNANGIAANSGQVGWGVNAQAYNVDATGSSETRVKNAIVNYIIKF